MEESYSTPHQQSLITVNEANDVTLDFLRSRCPAGKRSGAERGKPTNNGFIEAFNSKFRRKFRTPIGSSPLRTPAKKMKDWRRRYNEDRPCSAIGYKPPITLMNGSEAGQKD